MKVSVIISLCDNRFELFSRSLDTWANQTEKDFELILVDDGDRQDIFNLCKSYEKKIKFQFIKIDNSKCDLPITTFTPVLSNNVGIRMSRGEIVCITGPETLQGSKNIEVSFSFLNRRQCGYGLVYKSNSEFVNFISKNWRETFDNLLDLPGAKHDCLTRLPHPPAYYYYAVVRKDFLEKIGGLDEEFGQGFCGEDDDLANRLKLYGVQPIFEHNIVGIHQDHSSNNTKKHLLRYSNQELREKNFLLMKRNLLNKKIIANGDHLWGDPKTIIYHEVLG